MENQNLESIKKQLIEIINKKLEDKIIEQSNADLIVKLINRADTVKEAVDIAALGTTYKKTGFHFDKRLDKIVNNGRIKYFKKNNELSFSDGSDKPVNKLIIGDNFDALQNLLIQYKNSIDVIYIDPPYGKDSMGQFAETNYNNALTRDNLLSMLYSRLVLAKELLSDDGVIFCSIDDRNQAYVKCMFDDIFGEANFINTSVIVNNRGGRDYGGIALQHDYLLIYAKDFNNYELNLIEQEDKEFNYYDEKGGFNLMELRNRNVKFNSGNRPNLFYSFYLNPNKIDSNGLYEISLEKSKDFNIEVKPAISQGIQTVWRWGKEEKARKNLNIEIFGKDNKNGGYMIVQKYRKTAKMQRSIWDDKEFVNERGTESVKEIIGAGMFDYPKSPFLIKRIIELASKTDSLVLDFFAGSGTTGQAVLDLNKSDGGNRTFILCQLDENLDDNLLKNPKSNTIVNQIDFLNKLKRPHLLSEIATERLRRIMTGVSLKKDEKIKWVENNSPYGGSLDVYEIDSVANNESLEGHTPFDVIDETLYGKEKFINLQDKIDWVCSNFENCQKELKE